MARQYVGLCCGSNAVLPLKLSFDALSWNAGFCWPYAQQLDKLLEHCNPALTSAVQYHCIIWIPQLMNTTAEYVMANFHQWILFHQNICTLCFDHLSFYSLFYIWVPIFAVYRQFSMDHWDYIVWKLLEFFKWKVCHLYFCMHKSFWDYNRNGWNLKISVWIKHECFQAMIIWWEKYCWFF